MQGSIEKLPSGNYRLKYIKDGKIYRQTVECNTKTEAKELLNSLIASVKNHTYQPDNKITFVEFAQLWLDNYAKPNLSKTTWKNYMVMLNKNILNSIGTVKLVDVNKMMINQLLADLKEKGYKAKSLKNYLSVISAILGYACENDYIVINPCTSIKIRKNSEEEFQMSIYEKDEIKEMITALDNEKNRTFANAIKFDLYTGLRRGELLGLQVKDINFYKKEITVIRTRTVAGSETVIKDTKTHKSRTFIIPSKAIEILKEQCKDKKDDDFIFDISPKAINSMFNKFLKTNNLRHIRIYDLRHTNASMLHSEGVDYATIANRLGNLPSTTANFYIHRVDEKDKQASNILENLF